MGYFKELDIENQDLILEDFKNFIKTIGKSDKKITNDILQNYFDIRYNFLDYNLQGVGGWNKLEKKLYIGDIIRENYNVKEKRNKKRHAKINFDIIYYNTMVTLAKIKPIEYIIKTMIKHKIKRIKSLNYSQLVRLWNECDYISDFDIFLEYIEEYIEKSMA